MAQQIINVGATPNDGAGDPIRTAFIKSNNNFSQLYSRVQVTPPTSLVGEIGDEAGMYAYDSTYFYYCFANYDGSSIIWAQVTQVGNISTNQINSGNSNVIISGSGGNVVMGINGVTNAAVFTSTTANLVGNVVSGGYFIGDGSLLTGLPQTYANANVTAYAESGWGGNIVPSANATYNLGSATNQWKSLYVSNTTIYLGNVPIGITAGNVLTVNGNAVLTDGSNANISTSGNVTVGAILTDGYYFANGSPFVATSSYGNANVVANLAALASNPISTSGNVTAGNLGITGGSLTWANASIVQTSASDVSITGDGQVTVRSLDGTYQWTFDNAGNLTVPGNISTSANVAANNFIGLLGNITNLDSLNFAVENISALIGNNGVNIGAGGFNNLVVLPTDVLIQNVPLTVSTLKVNQISSDDSSFVTIQDGLEVNGSVIADTVTTTGNVSGNYFIGNGSQLTGINAGTNSISNGNSNVEIATANGNVNITASGTEIWNFGTDGRLTFPGTPRIDTDANNFEVQAAENINLEANAVVNIYTDTSGNAYQWQFGDDGNLTTPQGMVISGNVNFLGTDTALLNPADNTPLSLFSSGANGTVTSFWTDDIGNLMTSNIAALYLPLQGTQTVRIVNGNNGGNVAIYDFGNDGVFTTANVSATYAYGDTTEANVFVGTTANISGNITGNYILGNGSQLTGIIASPGSNIANGNSNVSVATSNGNVTVTSNGTNTWNFDTTGNLTLPNSAVIKDTAGNAVAFGLDAGQSSQGDGAVAIGVLAGNDSQGQYAVAIGVDAGKTTQGNNSVSIGTQAGNSSQGNDSVAIGYRAGQNTQSANAVAVGYAAGNTSQGNAAVAIGIGAGHTTQGNAAVAVGAGAGNNNQGLHGVAIGTSAGNASQSATAVAVGYAAGNTSQGNAAVAIGDSAGLTSQGNYAVALGFQAAITSQGIGAVAIGREAGNAQGAYAVAIGQEAGFAGQGSGAIAIGLEAGETDQGEDSVAIGYRAGRENQDIYAVAIGYQAGNNTQGGSAVAIGEMAGTDTQGASAVAVGDGAGRITQGEYAVALGYGAGDTNQGNNSIIINATGGILNQTTANTFTVAPIRNDVANVAEVVFYNTTSKEITYGNAISVTGNISGGNLSVTGNISGNTAGFAIGYLNIPQVNFAANATIAATDAGKHYYSTSASNLALTIANNTSVSWSVGTAITVVNRGTGNITVTQDTGVSLYLAGNSTPANRTVTTYGMATLLNVAANVWMIDGTGVS